MTDNDKAELIRNGVFRNMTLYYMVSLCVIQPDLFFKIAKKKAITSKERQTIM